MNLIERGERMNRTEFGPSERYHTACAVELHGAATERDHSMHEREILGLEVVYVSQHFGFGVVGVEDRMGKIL